MVDRNLSLQNQTSHILNGSNSINNFTDHDEESFSGFYYYLYEIIWPIISSLGIVGNSLSFVVLLQLSSSSSFYLYLAFLALSDLAMLVVGGIFRWLEMTGMYKVSTSFVQHMCSVSFASTLTFSQISSWITVAVTVDRYIAVCHPFKVAQYCTRKRALIYVAVAFLVIVAVNLPNICLEWDHESLSCVMPEFTNDYCLKYRSYIDLSVYVLIPFCLICIVNALIIRGLYTAAGRRRHLTSGNGHNTSSTNNLKDATMKTVTMLFTVTGSYLIFFIPFIGISFQEIIYGHGWDTIVGALADMCSLLNHSVNFILYGLSGKRFRDKFAERFSFRRPITTHK